MSPPAGRSTRSVASDTLEQSPTYQFPFSGVPISDAELQPMQPFLADVRHGNAEQANAAGSTGWWTNIPGVSRDPTPRQSPRGSRPQQEPIGLGNRAQLVLPTSADAQDDEEEPPSALVGTQLLTLRKDLRESKAVITELRETLMNTKDHLDGLHGRLRKAESIIEERFQTTVGVTETHDHRLKALEETLRIMRTFGGSGMNQGVPAPAQTPTTTGQHNSTAPPNHIGANPVTDLTRMYDMTVNDA